MNITQIDQRIKILTDEKEQCTCDGPMCTYLREEADRLISLYQNWKQELLDKQNVSNIEREMKNL